MVAIGAFICVKDQGCGEVVRFDEDTASGVMELDGKNPFDVMKLDRETGVPIWFAEGDIIDVSQATANATYLENIAALTVILATTITMTKLNEKLFGKESNYMEYMEYMECRRHRGSFGPPCNTVNKTAQILEPNEWPKPPPVGMWLSNEQMTRPQEVLPMGAAECFSKKNSNQLDELLKCLRDYKKSLSLQSL